MKMYKIAIVDDEISILEMMKKFLSRREELEIELFENPETAYNKLVSNNYDIIISDIMMPQMDGVELLRKIKEKKPNQKVIMMTAYSTEDRLIECDELGATDYITKPFISLRDVENKVLDNLGL
jgi:DNA-binding NtrC family response regulator